MIFPLNTSVKVNIRSNLKALDIGKIETAKGEQEWVTIQIQGIIL